MLELPEARVLAGQMDAVLAGREIVGVQAGQSPHKFAFFHGDPAEYPDRLVGRRVESAAAFGGRVEMALTDSIRLEFSDGVNLRYYAPGEEHPAKHQLFIGFADGGALAATVQMYGGLWAFAAGEMDDNFYYTAAQKAPSPLSDTFDRAHFDSLWPANGKKLSAKAFLATEQRIPGLGNGVLQDILFRAGVHPKAKMHSLSPGQIDALFDAVKTVLAEMTAQGGRDTEKDLFGCPGGYRTVLCKHNLDKPCPRCGGAIRRETYLGGNVYTCPVCQIL